VEPRAQEFEVDDNVLHGLTFCEVCGESDREDRMLLCDSCDFHYHMECLDPLLDTVPMGDWFCPNCIWFNSVYRV
jgi:PHD and RING finger domain-containing protein 1